MAASPGPQPWGWQSTLLGRVVIVCSFLFLNLSLNVLNKWFMSKYGERLHRVHAAECHAGPAALAQHLRIHRLRTSAGASRRRRAARLCTTYPGAPVHRY